MDSVLEKPECGNDSDQIARGRVTCIIPHYGKQELLDRCLAGIPDFVDVRVIDNNQENRLFTKAVNIGLRSMRNDQIAWILNNDCIPQPGCVDAALQCFEDDPRCGIVGCQNRLLADPDQIVWGGSLDWYPVGKHKCGYASRGQLQERTKEEWATFASVFVSGVLIREIGLLDENMLHICSDADYCLRSLFAGFNIYHEPKSVVWHEMGSSSKTTNRALMDVMRRDVEYMRLKWVEGFYHAKAD